jgi:hypothetical protein
MYQSVQLIFDETSLLIWVRVCEKIAGHEFSTLTIFLSVLYSDMFSAYL